MKHILAAVLALGLTGPVFGEEPSIEGIEKVISSQIQAFLVDDFETAFNFASPELQAMFRTPERFGQMVRNGYPMVWRPSQIEFLALETINGLLVQKVLIQDAKGSFFVADYVMTKTEDGWQISGVHIERSAELST
ncbi:MAG: hypothetical protein ACI861_000341 [Paracoccaceae bacterium]|jgi:hypothetical protein